LPNRNLKTAHTAEAATYNQLAGIVPEAAPDKSSSIAKRLVIARSKPLHDLTPAEVRLLINRHEPPAFPLIGELLDSAQHLLEHDLTIEVDYYPGDLLYTLLKLPESAWRAFPEHYKRFRAMVEARQASLESLLQGAMKRDLPALAERFLQKG